MADAPLSSLRRVRAVITVATAGLIAGLALGHASGGLGEARFGGLVGPGVLTLSTLVAGIVVGTLTVRSAFALRLTVGAIFLAAGGLVLTRIGPGLALAFGAAPLLLWVERLNLNFARTDIAVPKLVGVLALGTGVLLGVPGLALGSSGVALPGMAMAALLLVGGLIVLLQNPGDERPESARFDLRVALAMAALVAVGFGAAFVMVEWTAYVAVVTGHEPERAGRLIQRLPNLLPLTGIVLAQFFRPPLKMVLALGGLTAGFLLAAATGRTGPLLLGLSGAVGLAVVAPSLKRAGRTHEALGVSALLLATALGMPLAAGLVNGFTRRLVAEGSNTAVTLGVNWGGVLGFYGLLALVVLLAHLAHAYEFGLAALDPDDDRDPLPILRKGLPKFGQKG